MSRPRSRNLIDLPSSACVPTTMSIEPSVSPFLTWVSSFGRDQARGLRDLDRKAFETIRESLGMLARQQRGRHDHGDLLAFERDRERRAQRHLGLAEADVAADQPIHRAADLEILQRRLDRAELVLGLVIGEARAELVIEAGLHRQLRRLMQHALGGDLDQFARDLADAVLQPGFARLPAGAAEPIELDIGLVGAVARQQLDVLDRQEQLGVGGIVQLEAIVRRAGRRRASAARRSGRCHARHGRRCRRSARLVTSEMKLSSLRLALRGRTRRSPRMSCSLMTATSSVSKPLSMPSTASIASLRGVACTVRQALTDVTLDSLWSRSMLAMRSREPSLHSVITTFLRWLCSAWTCATTASNTLTEASLRSGAKSRPAPRAGVEHARGLRHREWREARERALAEPLPPFLLGQIEPVRRQRLVDRAAAGMFQRVASRLVIVRDLLEALARGVLALRLDRNRRVAEIVEQRVHPLLEQRQPVLHAGIAAAFADGLIQRIVGSGRAELRGIGHAEAADGLGDQLEFRDRHQIERAHVEQRALGLGIEGADRFQGVAEEVEAHGLVRARPERDRGCRRAPHIRRARARSRSGYSRCAPARR